MPNGAIGREAIYAALFAQLNATLLSANGGPFNYSSRRYQPLGSLSTSQYPAFFLVERGEMYDRKHLWAPAKVSLLAHVVIQSAIGIDPNVVTATEVNDLADAVESAVGVPSWTKQPTPLLGLVQIAWINGREIVVPGSIKQQYSEQDLEVELILPHAY